MHDDAPDAEGVGRVRDLDRTVADQLATEAPALVGQIDRQPAEDGDWD